MNRLLELLADVGQGASNGAASIVSAPVDGIALLLRKAGLPSNNPVGGSNWMAQRGLTVEPKNRLAGLLGESISGIAPIVAGAYAPKIAAGLLNLDAHAMDMARRGIEARMVDGGLLQPAAAWHGPLQKGDLARGEIQDLISSQRYLDRSIVAKKIKAKDFKVRVTPSFALNGEKVRAITDGHHALEAAIRSGNKPAFITDTVLTNDRIAHLKRGAVDDYLEAAYHDSPWYWFSNKVDLF